MKAKVNTEPCIHCEDTQLITNNHGKFCTKRLTVVVCLFTAVLLAFVTKDYMLTGLFLGGATGGNILTHIPDKN